jgi:hypothetical protein
MIKLADIIKELNATSHYDQRKEERGKILDIVNLKEIIPNIDEVKPKLISVIEQELNKRLDALERKDIPSSLTYNVGVKVMKAVLIANGKENTLTLKVKYTNPRNIEVESIGVCYVASVKNQSIKTIMLVPSENGKDIESQFRSHAINKGSESEEIKLFQSSDYVCKIRLEDILGISSNLPTGPSEDIMVDPNTLDYKIKADYRIGQPFEHKKFGKGIVIKTSEGAAGRGNSKGQLDWIEVQYDKPFLKGGKLTNIRKFERIYTTYSPLIKK